MPIVWDEPKRLSNLANHGFDFADVETDFDFASAIITPSRGKRLKAIGPFQGRVVVLVFAPLGSEAISLISLRRASRRERKALE